MPVYDLINPSDPYTPGGTRMCHGYDPQNMACKGAPTITVPSALGDFARCQACGDSVRSDLVDHPFWGFKNCDHAKRELLERIIAAAEYHRDLPHAFREEVMQADLVIADAKQELRKVSHERDRRNTQ